MPRLIFRLPKYSLHKSSGNAKVRFNGKTVYLGKYGTADSKEEYAKFIASIPKPEEEITTFAEPGARAWCCWSARSSIDTSRTPKRTTLAMVCRPASTSRSGAPFNR